MPKKIAIINLITFFMISVSAINAQNTISTSGGELTGTEGTVSYTIGQSFYKNNTGTNGSVIEGVQQPYEISVVSTEDEKKSNQEIKVFPNPTLDIITIKIINDFKTGMKYNLYDDNGKILISKVINTKEIKIKMGSYSYGTYFLKLLDKTKEIKTFKIIKN